MATTYIQDALTDKALRELYPTDDGSKVVIEDEAIREAVEDYLAMQELEAEAKKAKEAAARIIKTRMGHAAEATIGAYKVTWKAFEKAEYTVAAQIQRPIKVKKTSTPD